MAQEQVSSQQDVNAVPAELGDTADSLEQALRRIADLEANCIDVNYTRVRQQRLTALGQDEAASSLSAGSSSGLIDPEFDALHPRASSSSSSIQTGPASLAAQRECLRLLTAKFNALVASSDGNAAVRVCQLRVQLAQAAAARDVAQQSLTGMSAFAKDALLDMRSVFNAGARVMAALEAKKDEGAGVGAADDLLALHTRSKTVTQHYKTVARRGDQRMCTPPPPPPPQRIDRQLVHVASTPPPPPSLQKCRVGPCRRQARALPPHPRRVVPIAAQRARAPRHRTHLLLEATQDGGQRPFHIQPCASHAACVAAVPPPPHARPQDDKPRVAAALPAGLFDRAMKHTSASANKIAAGQAAKCVRMTVCGNVLLLLLTVMCRVVAANRFR